MLTPFSESMQELSAVASAALNPEDPPNALKADLVAVVLHDTPVNARKKLRITSRKRKGLTRRAPGSPITEAAFTRPSWTHQPMRSPGAQGPSGRSRTTRSEPCAYTPTT